MRLAAGLAPLCCRQRYRDPSCWWCDGCYQMAVRVEWPVDAAREEQQRTMKWQPRNVVARRIAWTGSGGDSTGAWSAYWLLLLLLRSVMPRENDCCTTRSVISHPRCQWKGRPTRSRRAARTPVKRARTRRHSRHATRGKRTHRPVAGAQPPPPPPATQDRDKLRVSVCSMPWAAELTMSPTQAGFLDDDSGQSAAMLHRHDLPLLARRHEHSRADAAAAPRAIPESE